jgi:hypothetical protein
LQRRWIAGSSPAMTNTVPNISHPFQREPL